MINLEVFIILGKTFVKKKKQKKKIDKTDILQQQKNTILKNFLFYSRENNSIFMVGMINYKKPSQELLVVTIIVIYEL